MPVSYTPSGQSALFANPARVYAFFGEDDWEKRRALDALRTVALDPEFADFDADELDATQRPVEDILASAQQVPFGSTRRLVVVRSAEQYRKREGSASAEKLAAGLASLGASTCLVLMVAASDDERQRKTAFSAKLDKAIEEHGKLVKFNALGDEGLARWVVAEALSVGKKLEPRAAARLAEAANGDRRVLAMELDKALLLAGDSVTVGLDIVNQTVSDDPDDVMFPLIDAVLAGNSYKALPLLRETISRDGKAASTAPRLITLLARQFRLLYQASCLRSMGFSAAKLKQLSTEALAELPSDGSILSMAWKGGEIFRLAEQWGRTRILQAMTMLSACDAANKGAEEGLQDPEANLQVLVVQLCGLAKT